MSLWVFFTCFYTLQPNVCKECHDILMMPIDIKNTDIQNINGVDDRFVISGIYKKTYLFKILIEKIGSIYRNK